MMRKSIYCVASLTLLASIAHADVITVSMAGSIENVDDNTGVFDGVTRWTASIAIDTDTTVITPLSSDGLRYSGLIEYEIGANVTGSMEGVLQVSNVVDDENGIYFDVLAIDTGFDTPRFFALDLGGFVFDSTDLPPLGLTFAPFSPGVVGSTYEHEVNNQVVATVDIVVDTISVVPAPTSTAVLAFSGLLATRRRR